MAQSLVQIYLHIVFSTKHREPYLDDKNIRSQMHAYLAGICHNQGAPSLIVGGVENHVHILSRMSKLKAVADFIRDLKRDSSKWIKSKYDDRDAFHWQDGYGAFSVSPTHVNPLKTYIARQEQHHRKESFQDEFRRLCRKYGVELDERYAWD